ADATRQALDLTLATRRGRRGRTAPRPATPRLPAPRDYWTSIGEVADHRDCAPWVCVAAVYEADAVRGPHRLPAGVPPKERVPGRPPDAPSVAQTPRGDPLAQAPPQHLSRVPAPHPVGKPPNPRRPRLVKHVHGGGLRDLFEIFADLPRPWRPPP